MLLRKRSPKPNGTRAYVPTRTGNIVPRNTIKKVGLRLVSIIDIMIKTLESCHTQHHAASQAPTSGYHQVDKPRTIREAD